MIWCAHLFIKILTTILKNLEYPNPNSKKITTLLNKFAFSSGSACASANPEPSHVLKAMGLNDDEIKNSFRFSFGKNNTLDEVKLIVEEIKKL